MPTIPASQGPRLDSAPLRGGMQSGNVVAGAFTGQAQAAQQLARGLGQAAEAIDKYQEREAADEAFRAETGIKSEFIEFENQLRQRKRGADAKGYADEIDAWWADAAKRHGDKMSDRAKRLANKSLVSAQMQARAGALRYEEGERQRSFAEGYASAQAVEIQRAVTSGDPAVVTTSRDLIRSKVAERAALEGWTPEQVQTETLKWSDILHRQMLGNLMNQDPVRAKAYLDEHRAEINGAYVPQLERDIGDAAQDVQAKQQADSMAAMPYSEQIAASAKIEDAKLREKVRTHIDQNQAAMLKAIRAEQDKASDTIWQMVGNGAGLSQLPRDVLARMDGKERVQVNEHFRAAAARARAEAREGGVKTDWGVYNDLREQIRTMPPAERAKFKLSPYQHKLAGPQMEQLNDLLDKVRDPSKAPEAATAEQQIASVLKQLHIKPGDDKAGLFAARVYDEFNAFIKQKGREADYEERQKILDRLVLPGEVESGSWWRPDANVQYFEATPEQRAKFVPDDPSKFTPDIPPSVRERIIQRIKSRKEEPTEARILDAYRKLKGQ